jgi:hypothetical protein
LIFFQQTLIEKFQARFDLDFASEIVIAIEKLIRIDRTLIESIPITFFNLSRPIALRPVPLGGLVAQEGGTQLGAKRPCDRAAGGGFMGAGPRGPASLGSYMISHKHRINFSVQKTYCN